MCAGSTATIAARRDPLWPLDRSNSRLAAVTGTKLPPMPRKRAESVLSALGVSAADERRYQQVLPLSGAPVANVATALGVHAEDVGGALAGLAALGIVVIDRDRVTVLRVGQVVSAAIAREAETTSGVRRRLDGHPPRGPAPARGTPAMRRPRPPRPAARRVRLQARPGRAWGPRRRRPQGL